MSFCAKRLLGRFKFYILLIFLINMNQLAALPTMTNLQSFVNTHKMKIGAFLGIAATLAASSKLCASDYGAAQLTDKYYWDWTKHDMKTTQFPSSFLFGVGSAALQVEGDSTNSDWYRWEHETDAHGEPRVKNPSGKTCDHWNKYKEDIALMEQMGVGVYRFSLAWDKIEPEQDTFNQDAIDHYIDLCKELQKRNIKILIGFHHYAEPIWFADIGAFEKEENISYFVRFCTHVITAFQNAGIEVDQWTTFNAPSGYAFHKYMVGDFPPGIKNNKQLTLSVLKNVLEAHVQAYKEIKKINPTCKVGLLHNVLFLDPWRSWNPLDQLACKIATKMTDSCIYEFFTTGTFKAKIPFDATPFMANVVHTNHDAPYCVDFIGINYYSHSYLKNMKRIVHPDEIKTDNPNYTIYPEGLYRAIVSVTDMLRKPLEKITGKKIPVFIAESGITHKDEQTRILFFERYMYAMHKAIQDGYDVDGFILWAFMDNYGWGTYAKQYGLVKVDFNDPLLPRSIKTDSGTQYFINLMKRNRPMVN